MQGSFVTVLFTDLVDSSGLLARHGDEAADVIRRLHFGLLREAMTAHGGREVKSTGDGLMVAFASAAGAVRSAVAMQRANADLDEPLDIRIGMDAGEPIDDDGDLYGTPVHVARRLCDSASPGQVLVSDVVRQIASPRTDERFASVGALRLKGVPEPVGAAEIVWRDDAPARPAGPGTIRVLIADDEQLLRTGFRIILEAESGIEVVAEAADGRAAIELCAAHRPDVVLMDIRMPELDGLAAAERILCDGGENAPRVVMLTTFGLDEYVYRALRIGVTGFLLKDTPTGRLIDAVRAAAAGDALIEPSIVRRLVEAFTRATPDSSVQSAALSALTDRELDVLKRVARGLSNTEVADEIRVAESTVKTHVARILMKLGLRDRVQAVVFAYESGLVSRAG